MSATLRRSLLCIHAIVWLAALSAGAGTATSARAQTTPVQWYETKCRLLIIHKRINQEAQPVPVDVAAAAHAAKFRSTEVAELAVRDFRLNDLESLKNLPADEVAKTIGAGVITAGRPSTEATNVSILEVRVRSTNVADAMALAKALAKSYQDFLSKRESSVEAGIERARENYDSLAERQVLFGRAGKIKEAAETKRLLEDAEADLSILKLKARVGTFEVVELDPAEKVTKVEN